MQSHHSLLTKQLGVLTPFMYQRWLDEEVHIINHSDSPGGVRVQANAGNAGNAGNASSTGFVVPSDHEDTLFWCLYIAKNGIDEYRKYYDVMKERKKNFEMEIKNSMMQDMSRNQHALLSRKSATEYKFTKKKLCEIFSSMMLIGCRTCMYTSLAICRSFEMGIFVVDAYKKLYLSMNVSPLLIEKQERRDDDDGGDDDDDDDDKGGRGSSFFVIYKRPRGVFGVDVNSSEDVKRNIMRDYVEVTIGGKPLRPMTTYKKDELLELCRKISPAFHAENMQKTKKKEDIYMALWEYMKWDLMS